MACVWRDAIRFQTSQFPGSIEENDFILARMPADQISFIDREASYPEYRSRPFLEEIRR